MASLSHPFLVKVQQRQFRAEPEGFRAGPSRAFYELFLCYTNEPTSQAFFEPSQEFHIVTSQIVNL